MEYETLEKLNKEFAENSIKLNKEFSALFGKWLKKDPRLTAVMAFQLPINVLFTMMKKAEDGLLEKVFPELPDMMERFLNPFMQLKDDWGKIKSKEFINKYKELYEKQFDSWFPNKEDKTNFEEWYKAQKRPKDKI